MDVTFRIIEAHPDEHTIVARFSTACCPEESLVSQYGDPDENGERPILRCRTDVAITLPIPAPTGQALTDYIAQFAPRGFFEVKEAVADPGVDTSLAEAVSLLGQPIVVSLPARPAAVGAADTVAPVVVAAEVV